MVFGFDMETDIGSFTPFYEGVQARHAAAVEAAEEARHPRDVLLDGSRGGDQSRTWSGACAMPGHETGCHGLYHETLGDPLFPLPNNWPILPSEVEGRLREATRSCGKRAASGR